MGIVNSIIDALASNEIIDLYFVVSDLIDIPIPDDEMREISDHDALSVKQCGYGNYNHNVGDIDPVTGQPWGKSVR